MLATLIAQNFSTGYLHECVRNVICFSVFFSVFFFDFELFHLNVIQFHDF